MRGEHVLTGVAGADPAGSSPHAWGTPVLNGSWKHTVGSSPHAWGTRSLHGRAPRQGRFIPTCVGNTQGCSEQSRDIAVHPHMRGEHGLTGFQQGIIHGSSPHAWGTRLYSS